MAQADLEVIRIVRRRHLHRALPNFGQRIRRQ